MFSIFSIPKIVGGIVSFVLLCTLIGKPEIPMKMILHLQIETMKVIDIDWGCPAIFDRSVCKHK